MKFKTFLLCAILSFGLAPKAFATLIDNGITTYDPTTALSWLDLTETQGLVPTFSPALEAFFADGWSIASGSQVDTLFENAGATAPASETQFYTDTTIPDFLISLLGNTLGNTFVVRGGQGWADNGMGEWSLPAYSVERSLNFTLGSNNVFDLMHSPAIGVYLVRPVPTPTPLTLMALGLILLCAKRRRRPDRPSRSRIHRAA